MKVQCCECIHGDFICTKYDINPYEQEWGAICRKEVFKEIIDPVDYQEPRVCDKFIKKED